MRCPSCGSDTREGAAFCETCGATLAATPPPPPPPPPPSPESAPGRTGARRRIGVVLLAFAVLAAAVGTGLWFLNNRDHHSGDAVSAPDPSGGPATAPATVMALTPSVLGSSGTVDPYAGFAIEDDRGTAYVFDDRGWTAVTEDGSVWVVPQAEAQLVEDDGRITIVGAQADVTWVEELLDDTPGLARSEGGWIIQDEAMYRDGVITASLDHGVFVDDSQGDARVVKAQPTDIGYVYGEADHAWIITRDGAGLIIEDDGSQVLAGSIMMGPTGALDVADFEPRPGYDTPRVRDILMGGKFGTYRTDPADLVPSADPACRTLDEIYAGAPVDADGVMTVSAGELAAACENRPEAQAESREQARIQQSWGAVWAERRSDEDGGFGCSFLVWDCVATGVAAAPGILESGYHATVGNLDDYTICLVGDWTCPDWYWQKLHGLWAERNCHSVGPGSGENGKGATRYDSSTYALTSVATAAGYGPDESAFAEERLALARAWMPRMELSIDEQCGEIQRVVARVTAYTPEGAVAQSLDSADRVEIVYTLFFTQDGGRFGREHHDGDNEGFVIALVRRGPGVGRCRGTDFEFLGGRAVAHKDASDWFQSLFRLTDRHIEDFGPGSSRGSGDQRITTACPSTGPEGGFFLHTAESKHATYYDRDVCEAALAPDTPTVLVSFLVGGPVSAATTQAVMNTIPDSIKWQDGMEECEFGRTPYDLTDRLELYDDAFGERTSAFSDHLSGDPSRPRYDGDGKDHSFGSSVRGVVCPWTEWPDCRVDNDFHVPGFWEADAGSPPGDEVVGDEVTVPNLEGDTESEAATEADTSDLKIEVAGYIAGPSYKIDRVVAQEPSGGTLPRGSTISVWLGSPASVAVPDLGGLLEADARTAVANADLVFEKAGTIPTSDSLIGRVVDQDPISGSVLVGTVVRVWIGVASAPGTTAPSFPAERTSSWVTITIDGGHGSTHSIGDIVEICVSWSSMPGEPAGTWVLWDHQPPDAPGAQITDGSMATAGSDCVSGTITGPVGYERFVMAAYRYHYGSGGEPDSWDLEDYAQIYIYVTN